MHKFDKKKKLKSAEKLKIFRSEIDGENLETATQFKYLGAIITEDARSVQKIKIRIAVATSSLSKLKNDMEGQEYIHENHDELTLKNQLHQFSYMGAKPGC